MNTHRTKRNLTMQNLSMIDMQKRATAHAYTTINSLITLSSQEMPYLTEVEKSLLQEVNERLKSRMER